MIAEKLNRPLAGRIAGLQTAPDLADVAPPMSDGLIQAASDALDRGETHYTDRGGIPTLRALVAAQYSRELGQAIDQSVVTITCGLIEARSVALRVLWQPGTAVICSQQIPEIRGIAHLLGAPVIERWSATQPIGIAYLTPADSAEMVESVLATEPNYIVWDTSIPGTTPHPGKDPAVAPRIATVGSLDAVLPGWRVGWIVGSDMFEKLRGFKQALTICTTNISQWAAVEWLNTHHS